MVTKGTKGNGRLTGHNLARLQDLLEREKIAGARRLTEQGSSRNVSARSPSGAVLLGRLPCQWLLP